MEVCHIIFHFVLVCSAVLCACQYRSHSGLKIHSDTMYSKCCDVSDTSTHGVRGWWVIICLLLILGYDKSSVVNIMIKHIAVLLCVWHILDSNLIQTGLLTAFYNSLSPFTQRIQIMPQTLPYTSFPLSSPAIECWHHSLSNKALAAQQVTSKCCNFLAVLDGSL
jgi:hypothetical protein